LLIMSYQTLVESFWADAVQHHSPSLQLINPHHDPLLAPLFVDKKHQLDYLYNPDRSFAIQLVGSHWWHSEGLHQIARKGGNLQDDGLDTCPFDGRLRRLNLKASYQFSNCAMGYIPVSKTANKPFTTDQIDYMRPKKLEEYRSMGTKMVFALGKTVLDFHLRGTGIWFGSFAEAVNNGCISLPCGLVIVPMPHPGALGIMTYLRMMGRPCDRHAQDAAFIELIDNAFTAAEVRKTIYQEAVD
jgi:hypothetical protein